MNGSGVACGVLFGKGGYGRLVDGMGCNRMTLSSTGSLCFEKVLIGGILPMVIAICSSPLYESGCACYD
jgi:hypothetical protein